MNSVSVVMCITVIHLVLINLNEGIPEKPAKHKICRSKKHHVSKNENHKIAAVNVKKDKRCKLRVSKSNVNKPIKEIEDDKEELLLTRDYEIHSDFIEAKRECSKSRELTPRIAYGNAAPKDMFPWMVAIYRLVNYSPEQEPFLESDTKFICCGSIITPSFILTAAHCFLDRDRLNIGFSDVMVRLGDYNIQSPFDDEQRRAQNSNVSALFIREDYDRFFYQNDIALLKLDQRIDYTRFIRPVCVPNINWQPDKVIRERDKVIVAGWGFRYPNYDYPSKFSAALRLATMFVYATNRCDYVIKYQLDPNKTLCVANYGPKTPRTCSGDSGSPLNPMTNETVLAVAIGVLSFGPAHCLQPSIFTNVQSYSTWINDIVNKNSD